MGSVRGYDGVIRADCFMGAIEAPLQAATMMSLLTHGLWAR